MPTSFSHDHAVHHEGEGAAHSADFAAHLDLAATVSAAVSEAALTAGAAALGAEPVRIVDLGSGTGAGTVALAQRFPLAHIDSLDIAEDLLAHLTQAAAAADVADRVHPQLSDLDGEWSDVVPAQVDLIWASLSVHHLQHPADTFRQAFDVLRPGGVLLVTEMTSEITFTPGDLGSGVEGVGDRIITALNDTGYPPTAEWSTELGDAGFTSVSRNERTVSVTAESATGARFLEGKLRRWEERLSSVLDPADQAALAKAVAELASGTSPLTHTFGRVFWVAVKPTIR